MAPRVLIIEGDPTFRRLLCMHLETAWPDIEITERDPSSDGALAPEFTAAAFDVVLSDLDPRTTSGFDALRDYTSRPQFPPAIVCVPELNASVMRRAVQAGAEHFFARDKLEHRQLVGAVGEAARKCKRMRAVFKSTPDAARIYRFGDVTIKGERFVRMIQAGRLCTVYLAESERAGDLVVLKVFHEVPDVKEGSLSFDRFLQEYEVVARVRHPNVVRIHDLGIADDHAYIAMEYFPQGDLRERLKGTVSVREALEYLRQMACALEAIHAVGVLHRDLKPGNVMMRRNGSIALIDFGLAKQLELEADITATGEIFGTPYYMSPEQGHGHGCDERSDIYSLGALFFELCSGQKPYLGRTPMEVIYKHAQESVPVLPPETLYLQPLIERMMAKSPARRFQSATALIGAIDSLGPAEVGA
ncbi:MAG: protein kinase domain-containing protein [Steroidobacteraceae bacterium]